MTGLQWAVLSAYARSLPRGPFRAQIEDAAKKGAPIPVRQTTARTLAEAGGLTKRGTITHLGKLAALSFVGRLGIRRDRDALLSLIGDGEGETA